MIEVEVADVSERITDLLMKIGDGETVLIKSEGRTVARLIAEPTPEARAAREHAFRVIDEMRLSGDGIPGTTIDEILAWRHEGHDR